MWVRKIGTKGPAAAVVLPRMALLSLGWEKGDYVQVSLVGTNQLVLSRYNPVTVPDRIRDLLTPLPFVEYA